MLATFDPVFGAAAANNPVSAVYGQRMVDPSAIHLWTWDARPFPVFPAALEVWSDGLNWDTGHWLSGRLGSCPLDALVAQILADAGVTDCDASALRDWTDGYVIDRPMSPRAALEPLGAAFAFEAATDGGRLSFRPRGGPPVAELGEDDLVMPDKGAPARSALPAAVGPAEVVLLDLPTLPADATPVLLRAAIVADPWPGPVAVWRSFDGVAFERVAVAMAPATVGETLDALPAGPTGRIHANAGFRVRLYRGALASAGDAARSRGRMRRLWCSRTEASRSFSSPARNWSANGPMKSAASCAGRPAANGRWASRSRPARASSS